MTSDRQSIELARHQQVVIVPLRGDLDFSDGPEIMLALDSARSDAGTTGTLLDLAGLSFADSTLLNLILRAQADYEAAARPFVLCGPYQRPVERLFEVTGVAEVLDLTATRENGLRRIRALLGDDSPTHGEPAH
ncbi:STAS domain-containing protein [Streptomyces sp. NPDC051684]|uniref:STAS domain-containing protein n=1 Tax=Streptomyces sp. NPDC051684 TaxID=3365670 RepID=UPI00379100F1